MRDKDLRAFRGRDIAMIFQDSMTALTPVYPVGWHIAEQIRAHERVSRTAARDRAVHLLEEVGIGNATARLNQFPHEFSGGMRQRVVIAMALACDPALLIADEPTTALDVTTQAQILDLVRRLRETRGSAVILITHDMGVVSSIADRVLVMYGGRAVEHGTRTAILRSPRHPYTIGLLGSVPRVTGVKARRLPAIPGVSVSGLDVPSGCAFAPRCRFRFDRCDERPELHGAGGHEDACWLPVESGAR
jgi:peptide/nickel transport system ATP-binding protein